MSQLATHTMLNILVLFAFSLPKVTVLLLLYFKCHGHTLVTAQGPLPFQFTGARISPLLFAQQR